MASVPPELSYVDYIVIVTGKSNKHMQALGEFVRKVYKLKKHKADLIPKLEGKDSKHWIALDLGMFLIISHNINIVFKIMLSFIAFIV